MDTAYQRHAFITRKLFPEISMRNGEFSPYICNRVVCVLARRITTIKSSIERQEMEQTAQRHKRSNKQEIVGERGIHFQMKISSIGKGQNRGKVNN